MFKKLVRIDRNKVTLDGAQIKLHNFYKKNSIFTHIYIYIVPLSSSMCMLKTLYNGSVMLVSEFLVVIARYVSFFFLLQSSKVFTQPCGFSFWTLLRSMYKLNEHKFTKPTMTMLYEVIWLKYLDYEVKISRAMARNSNRIFNTIRIQYQNNAKL